MLVNVHISNSNGNAWTSIGMRDVGALGVVACAKERLHFQEIITEGVTRIYDQRHFFLWKIINKSLGNPWAFPLVPRMVPSVKLAAQSIVC